MKKFVVSFIIPRDGHNLLWDIDDTATIEAKTADDAIKAVSDHCRVWGYNEPIIKNVMIG